MPLKSVEANKTRAMVSSVDCCALEAVEVRETILRAARTYGVSKSTLQVRVHGNVTRGVKPGLRPYLAPAEEKELSMFIVCDICITFKQKYSAKNVL